MELAQPLPSDGQLADAARRGSEPAWAELESRHGWAVRAVAKARRTSAPRRAALEAMDRLHRGIVERPPAPEGVAAVRALRPQALAELTGGTYGPQAPAEREEPGSDAAGGASDSAVLATAFARLPEPWQTVLWHSVVERRAAGEMTPLLGRGVNDLLALLHTARAGLHKAYLRAIAEGDGSHLAEECRTVVPLLSAAARKTLAAPDQRVVDDHIATGRGGGPCRECRARLDLASTIDERLPTAIVPGITGLSVERYRAAIGAPDRSFGAAALRQTRSDRSGRLAVASAAVVIVVAAVVAFLVIRRPFDDSSIETAITGSLATTTEGGTAGQPSVPPPVTTAPDGGTTTPPSSARPTTTELLLRPTPDGPASTVELVFAPGTRAVGAAAPNLPLAVELSSQGRVYAGGTGTIDVTVANEGAAPVEANVEVRTPNGVLFDSLVSGDATCRGPRDDAAFCNIALDAGETTAIAVRLRLESSVVGRLIVDPGSHGQPLTLGIAATPRLVHSSVGRGEILMVGNTLMTCGASAPPCAAAQALTGDVVNRWDLPMEFVGAVPALGWVNSSSATLDLPAGVTVEAAYLFWSGDLDERGVRIPDDGVREQAAVLGPDTETPVAVVADRLFLGDVDASQYLGYADVTEVVSAAGAGEYVVGNVASVETQGSYAGWALVVVTDDAAQPRRQHVVISPFAWFAPDDELRREVPVPFGTQQSMSLELLAFEGEPGFAPERLAIGGTVVDGDNVFDGSIAGARQPAFLNNFGVDVETYDLTIDAPDGTLVIDATSDKDGVRLAVLGLAVEVPS